MVLQSGLDAAQSLEGRFQTTASSIERWRVEMETPEEHSEDSRGEVEHSNRNTAATTADPALSPLSTKSSTSRSAESSGNSNTRGRESDVVDRLLNFGLNQKVKQDMKRRLANEDTETYRPQITPAARAIVRDEPVEDLLLKRRSEYVAHIEEMRRAKERAELEKMRSPVINRSSKSLIRTEPAYNRLYESRRETLAKRELLKNQLKQSELAEFKGVPQINPQSRNLKRGVDHFIQWEREKRERKQKLAEELSRQEMQSVRSPRINPISQKIVKHLPRQGDVFEHLAREAERRREEAEERRRRMKEEERIKAKPMISPHSANLQRDEPVFDRLYQMAEERLRSRRTDGQDDYDSDEHTLATNDSGYNDRKNNNNNNNGSSSSSGNSQSSSRASSPTRSVSLRRKSGHVEINPETGLPYHRPFINPRSSALVRDMPVEEILHKKGQEREAKRRQLLQQEEREARERSGSKIGAYSQLLVELMEKRTNMSSQERLTMPIGHKIKETTKKLIKEEEKKVTHRPWINPRSRQLSRSRSNSASRERPDRAQSPGDGRKKGTTVPVLSERMEQLFRKGEEYAEKRRKLQEQHLQEQLAECTFSPRSQSPRRSRTPAADGHHHHHPSSSSTRVSRNTSLVERSLEWKRRREERLEEERQRREESELAECTFRPNTSRSTSPAPSPRQAHPRGSFARPTYASAMRSYTPPPPRTLSRRSSSPSMLLMHSSSARSLASSSSGSPKQRSYTPPPPRSDRHDRRRHGRSREQQLYFLDSSSSSRGRRGTLLDRSDEEAAAELMSQHRSHQNGTLSSVSVDWEDDLEESGEVSERPRLHDSKDDVSDSPDLALNKETLAELLQALLSGGSDLGGLSIGGSGSSPTTV